MMATNKREFNCTYEDLATGATRGWDSYLANVEKFAQKSPKYTEAYGQQKKAAIAAAKNIKTFPITRTSISLALEELELKNKALLELWMDLGNRISQTRKFKSKVKSMKIAAGHEYYSRAYKGDWQSTNSLITNATNFMAEYEADLTADDNMPPDFPATFATLAAEFRLLRKDYDKMKEGSGNTTKTRLQAYNEVYNDLMLMFTDGIAIGHKYPELMSLFVWETVLDGVRSHRMAGVTGFTRLASNNKGIPGFMVKVLDTVKTAVTDQDGRYGIKLAAGAYQLEFSKAGFDTVIQEIEVQVGISKRLSLHFTPVSSGEHEIASAPASAKELEIAPAPVTSAAPAAFDTLVRIPEIIQPEANGHSVLSNGISLNGH